MPQLLKMTASQLVLHLELSKVKHA